MSGLPSDDEVRQAMALVLAQARNAGRRPTVTAVERELGITHPTFYRNYPDLIAWFKEQAPTEPGPATTPRANATEPTDSRREVRELRARLALYAEAIRQLTLDNAALRAQLDLSGRVIDLDIRQRERTTDRNEDPS